jgi:lipopolysaccharide/colanic/teichoic acid biosynthesis glycosyltransferase
LHGAATIARTALKTTQASSSETGTIEFLKLIDFLAKATKEALNLRPHIEPSSCAPQGGDALNLDLSIYFKLRRVVDVIASAALLVSLLPLALITTCLVLFDVGTPVFCWRQRVGLHGRKFLLCNFRTYHATFDDNGARIPEDERLSSLGRAIRAGRLDEIPLLLNVLVGDMSLIGPRPLLPVHQPRDPRLRLSVRPGIIGWGRINGGTTVTRLEEEALDDWYIRHASFWLDLKIAVSATLFAFSGERKNLSAPTRERSSFRRVLRRLWRRLR